MYPTPKIITCDIGEQTRDVTITEGIHITQDGEMQTAHLTPQGQTTQTESMVFETNESQTRHYSLEDVNMQTDIKEFKEYEVQSESPYQDVVKVTSKGKVKITTCDIGEQTRNVTIFEGERAMQDGEMQTPHHESQTVNIQTESNISADNESQTRHYSIEEIDMQTETKEFKEIEIQSENPYHEETKIIGKKQVKIVTCDIGEQTNDVIIVSDKPIMQDGEIQTFSCKSQVETTQTDKNIFSEVETQTKHLNYEDINMQIGRAHV